MATRSVFPSRAYVARMLIALVDSPRALRRGPRSSARGESPISAHSEPCPCPCSIELPEDPD